MTTLDTIRLDQLDARIKAVWLRGQVLHLLAGLLAMLRWAVPLFLVSVLIDWLTYMPAPGRGLMLAVLVFVSIAQAWRCGWRYLRPFDIQRTALQLEAHHGDLKSLLISAIQFRAQAANGEGHALHALTFRQAEEAAATLRPDEAVPFDRLRRPGVIALALACVIGLFAVINGPFLAAGLTRIFTPWLDAEYPTHTQITLDPNVLVIQEGSSAQIEAQLDGVIPEDGRIFVRTGEGKARAIELDVVDNKCVYPIASASRDFTYRFKIGDDRTDWQQVRVVPAPRVEQVAVELDYPEYLQRSSETIEALTLTVPEGTRVNWRVTLDRPIRSAQFVRDGQEPIGLTITDDGRGVRFREEVTDSRGYHFAWVEKENGFEFDSPRYYLQVASDQAPRVELTEPSSNLVAMVGRPLELVARAQDDHGLAAMKVAYRVNQREEQAVDLPAPPATAQGERAIDWDYRAALPDLAIGDSVAFTIEVRDRYPGPSGPHVVRSDTRRITFLSQDDYLAQIEKQKDRLLSRVQTIYRQQRSAHDTVRNLDPADAGYMQACQMEAIRQELLRDQIKDAAEQMQALLDDLAANNISEAAQGEALGQVRADLIQIADRHIASAASLLRDQSAVAAGGSSQKPDPARAARMVNIAARGLGSLVLLRSIDSAQEVYARETRMLAEAQAILRWRSLISETEAERQAIVETQAELAAWTDELLADLRAGMRYDKRPLAVLRLTRSVEDLDAAGPAAQMAEATALLRAGKPAEAADVQAELVRLLLSAEFSVRLSGAYSTLIQTRDQLGLLLRAQSNLREQVAGQPAEAFAARRDEWMGTQRLLRKLLTTMLLPTVPAPRAELFDETLPVAPDAEALLQSADRAMALALQQLSTADADAVVAQQRVAEQALAELEVIVDRWSIELGLQTQGLATVVAATSERIGLLESYEVRVLEQLEAVDIAASEEKPVTGFAAAQQQLADEIAALARDLSQRHAAEPDRDLPPLLSRLARIERAMAGAADALKSGEAEAALEQQITAADALAEAYALVLAQNERLALLQDLLMFQRSVGFASRYMGDIVDEQRDLLAMTEHADEDDADQQLIAPMLPRITNLRRCLAEVAPLLDLVAGRVDTGTPLAFAAADLEDAVVSLELGDTLDAVDAQDVAAESLDKVRQLVKAVQAETGYVAEIIEYLHRSVADAAVLEAKQAELLQRLEAVTPDQVEDLSQQQRALLAQAEAFGDSVQAVTGMAEYAQSPRLMRDALGKLGSDDPASAAGAMESAQATLTENAESLFAVITMLHGLPSIVIDAQTEDALIRLIDALALASAHKQLFRETQAMRDDDAAAWTGLAERQSGLEARAKQVASAGPAHPMLSEAHRQLSAAVAAFGASDREALKGAQKSAAEQLRRFIIEQALILETAVPPPAAEDGSPTDDGPGSDAEAAFTADFISDFVTGETPKDKQTEWKVLADRNRAALNQNFARELPLEYRGLLKDYYERVAE